jgi:UTP--glucose-1-phosphate uridylyltransferase
MSIAKAVFVGGLGTRFLPATKASPKEMLPLVDKPLIQYVVEEARLSGITDAIFVTGRGKRAIEDHFDTIFELEHTLRKKGNRKLLEDVRKITQLRTSPYVRQGALGLGHAILCARNLVGNDPFAVLLGDDIIRARVPVLKQLTRAFFKHGGPVLAVQRVAGPGISDYGVIKGTRIDERTFLVTDLVEKPPAAEAPSDLAVIGRYVLTPAIFRYLEETSRARRQISSPTRCAKMARTTALRLPLRGRARRRQQAGLLQATVSSPGEPRARPLPPLPARAGGTGPGSAELRGQMAFVACRPAGASSGWLRSSPGARPPNPRSRRRSSRIDVFGSAENWSSRPSCRVSSRRIGVGAGEGLIVIEGTKQEDPGRNG